MDEGCRLKSAFPGRGLGADALLGDERAYSWGLRMADVAVVGALSAARSSVLDCGTCPRLRISAVAVARMQRSEIRVLRKPLDHQRLRACSWIPLALHPGYAADRSR